MVPEHRRGEIMGWSGTANTVGAALGAPVVGAVIDSAGPGGGFAAAGGVGLVLSVLGLAVLALARRRAAGRVPAAVRPTAPEGVVPTPAAEGVVPTPAAEGVVPTPAPAGADDVPARPAPEPTPR
jgi:MFS family permease